jgi:hypothetical protein
MLNLCETEEFRAAMWLRIAEICELTLPFPREEESENNIEVKEFDESERKS